MSVKVDMTFSTLEEPRCSVRLHKKKVSIKTKKFLKKVCRENDTK
jgi:hypothetical protein